MAAISRILVPTELSPSCAWAARYAAQLAQRLGAKLVFLHAGTRTVREVEEFLIPLLGNTPLEVVVRPGDPAEAIAQFAREAAADLIVMPTHAGGRFRRFLLGSVTAKVLHDVDCPVLTGVHREDAAAGTPVEIRNIVCAVDADASFAAVVRWAQDLKTLFQASLKFVHAVPAADETSDSPGETEIRRYLFDLAKAKFDALCRETGAGVTVSLAGGPVQRVVREAALHENAELVIIGRGHAHRTLGRLRTHAYAIIRNSPCPVLSI